MKLSQILAVFLVSASLVIGLSCSKEAAQSPATPTSEGFVLSIDINPSGGGVVERSSDGPYDYGDVVQITAKPSSGYQFDRWGSDIGGNTSPRQITVSGHTYIIAYFIPKDSDNDGLSDTYEYSIGTDPYLYDTDSDELSDSEEVDIGSNPLVQDTDSDGILDNSDLWPLADMQVQVDITSFTALESCDLADEKGGPYCIVKVDGLPQVELEGCIGSPVFNIADNVSDVMVSVEAWDDDLTGLDDPYNIYGQHNKISTNFNRQNSPVTVSGTGSAETNACQAAITVQISSIAGPLLTPTPAPTPIPTPSPTMTTEYISKTFLLDQGTLEVGGILSNFQVGDTFEGYFIMDRSVEYGVTLTLQGFTGGKSIGYTSGESFNGTRTFSYTLAQNLDHDSLEVVIGTGYGNCSPHCTTDTKYVTLYYKLNCGHCQMIDTSW
jgi:hypothetical protein